MAIAGWIKQSTAITIKIGPFVDDTDGKTAETALTLSQADIVLSKNGGAFAQKNESSSATHDTKGYYACAIDTTDTNTLGVLSVAIHESGALPIRQDYQVVTPLVWDSLFGADRLQVDVQEMAASITAQILAGFQTKINTGTLQSATSSTAVLTTGASSVDDFYNDGLLIVIDTNGNAQVAEVTDYVGSTRTATITPNWSPTPTSSYKYVVLGA